MGDQLGMTKPMLCQYTTQSPQFSSRSPLGFLHTSATHPPTAGHAGVHRPPGRIHRPPDTLTYTAHRAASTDRRTRSRTPPTGPHPAMTTSAALRVSRQPTHPRLAGP